MIRVDDDATGTIRTLTIDRPERRNALDPDTLRLLGDALEAADADPIVRVLVLAAEGPTFCAGGDIHVMRDFQGDAPATLRRLRTGLNRVVRLIRGHRCPVLCALTGDAYGAGAVLAAQCDVTIVAEDARLAFSFRHVGLIPDTGGTWLLPQALGLQRAKHLVWTGTPFSGAEAARWGLMLEAVPRAHVLDQVQTLARALAAGPPQTTALAKQALDAGSEGTLTAALEREARLQAKAILSADHAEGRDAFFEKRKPRWE